VVANAAPTKLTEFSKQTTADIYNIIDKNIVFKVFCCFSGFRSFQQKYNENDRNRLPQGLTLVMVRMTVNSEVLFKKTILLRPCIKI